MDPNLKAVIPAQIATVASSASGKLQCSATQQREGRIGSLARLCQVRKLRNPAFDEIASKTDSELEH